MRGARAHEWAKQDDLFYSEASDPSWPTELQKAFPAFAVRTRPEETEPTDVVAAIVWKYPAGMLQQFANLQLIQVLGAGVDHLWSDPRLPKHVPIARLVDPGLTARMTEYVLLHSLALHRRHQSFETPSARIRGAICTPDLRPIPVSASWGSACLAAVALPLAFVDSMRSAGAARQAEHSSADLHRRCRP